MGLKALGREERIGMIGYIIGLIGIWILQDSVASIAFYPNEKWRWNHIVRMVRGIMGIVLIIFGALLI